MTCHQNKSGGGDTYVKNTTFAGKTLHGAGNECVSRDCSQACPIDASCHWRDRFPNHLRTIALPSIIKKAIKPERLLRRWNRWEAGLVDLACGGFGMWWLWFAPAELADLICGGSGS